MWWIALGVVVALLVALYLHDRLQTKDPILRNYPVLGWGRKGLTELGPLFRQYLFSNDREETPYNRITRDWIKRTALGQRNNVGFGTQEDMDSPGSIFFLPATFTNKAARVGDDVGTAFRRIIGGRGDLPPVPIKKSFPSSPMSVSISR